MLDENNTVDFQIEDNSDIDASVIAAAVRQYNAGKYREALNLLQNALHTSVSSDLYLNVGNCYYKLESYSEAFEHWKKAADLDTKNSYAYANIGNLYYRNAEVEKAISFWLVALISRPEDAKTCLNLAIAYTNKGMRFEAIKYYEKYIKYCEDKTSEEYKGIKQKIQHCFLVANEYLKFGVDFQSNEDDKKAAACYFKSLANYPNLSKTNLNLGSIFFKDQNLELAIKYWRTASFLDPNYSKIFSNLAISYDLMKEYSYAYCYYYRYMNFLIGDKDEYNKVNQRLLKIKPFLNKNPALVERHLTLAKEHVAASEYDEAIEEFKNYSILNPTCEEDYKGLIKKLQSYINPELDIIATCFEIGSALIAERKYSKAKSYFYRIMVLSSPQYLEFSKAKAKYSQCERYEFEKS